MKSLYLSRRFYIAFATLVVLFVAAYLFSLVQAVAEVLALVLAVLLLLDILLLYRVRHGVNAFRATPERLSNGDDNELQIHVANRYRFPLRALVLDELPFQFQARDAAHILHLAPGEERTVRYIVRPVQRGVYSFGVVNVYAESPIGLAQRRFQFDAGREVPVYPSFLQMRQYELLAISNRLEEVGVKKMRRLGHTMEFDHVRDYVLGDDPRTINWKATARRSDPRSGLGQALMVNQYRDERAQPVYCVIDMGRVMQMPFEEMTLLDYSINASLVLSNIALLKQDRAGLVTFSNEINKILPAERKSGQIYRIQEMLYNAATDFKESDYARLAAYLRRHLRQRSLVLLFTNFETRSSMRRQLSYLRALARSHVVVVVFFENSELRTLLEATPRDTEEIYIKTIAEKFAFEKREIVKELNRHGIYTVLTPPDQLSVNTINAYLEMKARGVI